LYEALLEGIVLFVLLWWYSAKPRPTGAIGGLFLLGYGAFRFFVEYFREPDAHIGLYALGFSQGQLLCIPMIALGLWLMLRQSNQPTQGKNKNN
jgi:phosphatidylglycerol:prolipoprotein diacylglycerol transferase